MKPNVVQWRECETRESLAHELACCVSSKLAEAIQLKGRASLIISGGTTPSLFFEALSEKSLPWSKVFVTLADERFVPENSPRSNAALVREKCLRSKARDAIFFPLFSESLNETEGAKKAEERLSNFPFPADIAILGMGNDGHTASFFPDSDELDQLLDPLTTRRVCDVHAPSAGEPRLTLTLPSFLSAHFLAFHIEGEEKKMLLQKILSEETNTLPIRRVINALSCPAEIFWAPQKNLEVSSQKTKNRVEGKEGCHR